MSPVVLRYLVLAAGVGQLILIVASLAIPRVLGWKAETAKLRPLTRQVFWTYAAYIWATNLSFGLLSALAPGWLLSPSPLAGDMAGFITAYWGCRIVIQLAYFDRSEFASSTMLRLGELGLVALFLYLTTVYGLVTVYQFGALDR